MYSKLDDYRTYANEERGCTCERDEEVIAEHTCPLKEEIYDNHKLCKCCEFCTYDCMMSV